IQQQANLGFNIGADNGADDNVQLGETVNFTNTDTNLVATVSDNGINYDLADTITVDSVTAGDSLLNNDGLTVSNGPNGPVSLTNTGLDNGGNTITNIAAGSLADGSTDAINGSQLNTAADSIATTLGGDSIFDPATGTVTSPNYVLDDGTNTGTSAAPFTNVGAALGNLDTRTTTNTGDIADIQQQANLGFNIGADNGADDNVQLGETVNFTNTDTNLVATVSDNGINYDLADTITVDSVTAGDSLLNNDGLTVSNGPNGPVSLTNTGLDNGGNTITNIAAGSLADGSTDAINGSQLNTAADSIATTLGGDSIFDPATGTVTSPNYVLDDGTNTGTSAAPFTNVGAALGNLDTRTTTNTGDIADIQQQANLGFNIGADNGADDNVQLGETVNFTNTDTNLVATVSDNGINYDLADTITVDSVTAGDSLLNNDGLTVSNGPNGPVSLTNTGLDNGGNTITNIAAGSLADGSTDAINGSQLNTAADSIATTLGGDSIFDPATGTVTSPNYVLDDGTNTGTSAAPFTNVGAALGNLDTRTTTNTGDIADIQQQANLGFNIGADNGADDNVQLGETVNFTNTDTNLVATVSDNGINYDLADTITVDSVTAGDSLLNNDGLTVSNGPNGPVSLTNTGLDNGGNTITNIAAGSLADGSTDAINGSQLNTAADSIATTLGGDSIFDPATGTVTSPNYVLDDGTNTGTSAAPFTNVGAALGNLDTRTTTNTGDIADIQQQANLGFNIGADNGADDNVQLGETVNFTNTDTNLVATVSDNGINYDLADTITVDSVTAGDSLLNNDGLTVSNGPNGPVSLTNTGLDNGGNTITNIAAGSLADGSTDAINGSQLNTAADSIATTLGGDSIFDPATGTVTSPNYVLDDGTNTGTSAAPFTNVGAALGNLDTRTTTNTGDIADIQQQANLGFNIGADNGADDNVQLGETVNFTNTDTNLVATVSDNGINYDLAEAIDLGEAGSVRVGNTITSNAGITVTGGDNDTVLLSKNGLNNGDNRVINVADGIAADDAATFGQVTAVDDKVDTLGSNTATNLGGGAAYNAADGSVNAPTYTLDTGTNTGATTNFNNVGGALENLDGRTTANTSDIDDINAGRTGIVRQDAGTGAITVGAQTGGNSVSFTGTDGDRQLTGVASAGDITDTANANNAVNAGDVNAAVTGLADAGLNFVGDDNTIIDRNLGDTLNVTGGANPANLTTGNIGVVANGTDGLSIQLAEAIDLGEDGSVTAGDTVVNNAGVAIDDGLGNATTITTAGTTVTDGNNTSNYGAEGLTFLDTNGDPLANTPSITATGIDAGTNKITNVGEGTDAGDVATFGQLTDTNNIATGNMTALGGSYDAATDTYTAPSYVLDDGTNTGATTNFNNVGGALENLDGRTTANTSDIDDINAGRTGIVRQDAGTGAITVGAQTGGNSVSFTGTDGDRQLTGVASAGDITDTANANNAVNAGDVNAAVTGLADAGLNFVGDDNTIIDRNLGDTLNVTGGANPANLTTGNIGVVANGTDGLSIQLAEAIDLGEEGSVTTGDTVVNNAGVAIDDGLGNATTITTEGTNVVDAAGNEADYTAASSSLSDGLGNTTNTTAAGTTVEDAAGNTSNYGAEGFTATDAAGNNGISINQGGISFIDAGGAPIGPSITAGGIDAGGQTVSNLADGVNANDAATKGQVDAVSDGLTDLTAGAVQYDRDPNDNSIINYDQVTLAGTPAVIDQDDEGNDFVASGGTTLSNVANGVNADDAVNKGQLDTLIAQNVTNVEVEDQDGNTVTVNVTDQVVNNNIDNNNMDSQFLTYDVNGQEVTDRLTIGETVQKMNTEGVKFAHTNAVSTEGDIGVTNDSSAGGDNSTAIGVNAIVEAGANNTVALGLNTRATADATNSVVIGNGSQVAGQSSVAIGDGAQALGNQSIAIGTGNIVNGDNSGAFGDPSTINGNNSYSVGNNNTINSDDTFVLGNGITANQNGSVVLGLGSAATTGAGIAGYLSTGNAAITATTSTTGAVAVGDAANGVYRQVTGVAAGTADSDAVNVSQLKSVSDALESSNEALSNAAVQYDTNPDDTVNKGSITLGGGAAGTTITNVNGGAINAGSTDAINGGQLYNLGNDVAGIIGGDAAIDDEGNLTATNIGGTGASNLNDAIAAVNNGNAQANEDIQANTDRLDTGLSFSADSGNDVNKSVGNSTALKFEGSDNITTTTTDSGIKFDLSGNINVDNVTAGTVTTGNTTVNTNGVTIANGPNESVVLSGTGLDNGGNTITGVADGINPTDAVNFGQLSALDGKLSNSVNELGYKINEVEDDANAGISAAMAMSSLPQAYIPGKSMIGGGVATYNGESAVAIGLSKVSDNGRWVMKINGTADTQGNAGGAIGAGFHF
ncbi:hypothetical protein AK824_09660, partial [Psychrobacter sp. P11G3]